MRYVVVAEEGPFPTGNGPQWLVRIEVEPPSLSDDALIELTRRAVWSFFESHRERFGERPGALVVQAYYHGDDLQSSPTATRAVLAPFGDLSATAQRYPDSTLDLNIELMPAHAQPTIYPCRAGDILRTWNRPTPLSPEADSWRQCKESLPPRSTVEVLAVRRFTNSAGQFFRVLVKAGPARGWVHAQHLAVGRPFADWGES